VTQSFVSVLGETGNRVDRARQSRPVWIRQIEPKRSVTRNPLANSGWPAVKSCSVWLVPSRAHQRATSWWWPEGGWTGSDVEACEEVAVHPVGISNPRHKIPTGGGSLCRQCRDRYEEAHGVQDAADESHEMPLRAAALTRRGGDEPLRIIASAVQFEDKRLWQLPKR